MVPQELRCIAHKRDLGQGRRRRHGARLAEHARVREGQGIFDVSHMGEVDFLGPGALDAVQYLITNDVGKLKDMTSLYTAVCLPAGGIVDDCIVYRLHGEHLRIVVNAANIEKDVAHFRAHAGGRCDIQDRSDEFALLAVQGPKAVASVTALSDAATADVPGFGLRETKLAGIDILAARTGYTGEDGFELFVPSHRAADVWSALREAGAHPIGLGARDTLRLEAKLCLYGNDIDETTTPLEAALGWTVKLDASDFVGAEALRAQKQAGIQRKLVGLRVRERGIPRPGWEVAADGATIGRVTSGGP
ncbi:MAG: glycine cleavage system aminomethyltransferase GcvT, partial [Nannocystaceae bacterium]